MRMTGIFKWPDPQPTSSDRDSTATSSSDEGRRPLQVGGQWKSRRFELVDAYRDDRMHRGSHGHPARYRCAGRAGAQQPVLVAEPGARSGFEQLQVDRGLQAHHSIHEARASAARDVDDAIATPRRRMLRATTPPSDHGKAIGEATIEVDRDRHAQRARLRGPIDGSTSSGKVKEDACVYERAMENGHKRCSKRARDNGRQQSKRCAHTPFNRVDSASLLMARSS